MRGRILRRWLKLSACCMLLLVAVPLWAKTKVEKVAFNYGGKARVFFCYVPDDAPGVVPGPLPVVVLLHGSGRDGTEMTSAWKLLAEREHFALAAPNSLNPAVWDSGDDPPAFLHAVVAQVQAKHPVDLRRVYLFGHSGGAVYALALALLDSEYVAAVAVHAGALPAGNHDHLFAQAKRQMPVAIWVGDRDAFFPLEVVKATQAQFVAHGFAVQLNVVANHTHHYEEASERVDRQAWDFLRGVSLPAAGPSIAGQ